MVPLVLFSDDTSGNRSKKWHKFESWFVSLAGLPRHLNARLENIHFVSCSDSVSPLDLSGPIAQELTTLETEGTLVFDAYFQEVVLVIAPLIVIVCDNPRASDLVNHLGSKALKYCRICMASYYHCIPITANTAWGILFYFRLLELKTQTLCAHYVARRKPCSRWQ